MGNLTTCLRTESSSHNSGTQLFTLIQNEEWSQVKARIIQKPDEVHQWTTLNLYGCDRKVLPLHLSCTLNPPEAVVQALLDVYPLSSQLLTESIVLSTHVTNSAFIAGEQEDWVALQIAIHFKASPDVIEALLVSFPLAAYIRNRAGRLSLHTVCKNELHPGSIEIGTIPAIVKLLLRAFPSSSIMTSDTGLTAIGYLNTINPPGFTTSIQWLQEKMKIMKVLQVKIDEYNNNPLPDQPRSLIWNKALKESKQERKSITKSRKRVKLHEYVLNKNWNEAISRCKKCPKEAAIWVRDETYQYDRLTLHMACDIKAPLELVNTLIDAYPDAVRLKDNIDMLAIHILVRRKADEDVIRHIIRLHPTSLWVRDSFGLLPLHVACTEGSSLATIEVLLMNAPDSIFVRDNRGYTAAMYSIKSMFPNRKEVLKALDQDPLFWRGKYKQRTYYQNGEVSANKSLHDLVSSCYWESACIRAKSFPIEAKLWMKDDDKYGRLPIHRCLEKNPPLSIVKALHSAYSHGIEEEGENGMLPLHIAIGSKASDEVIEYLIDVFPEGATIVDSLGRLPIVIGSIIGMTKSALGSLLGVYPESALLPDVVGKTPVSYVEASNHSNKDALLEILALNNEEIGNLQTEQSNALQISNGILSEAIENLFTSGWDNAFTQVVKDDKTNTDNYFEKTNDEQIDVSSVTEMALLNVDDMASSSCYRQVSGKRLDKLRAIRSTAGNDPEIREAKTKIMQLARRSRAPNWVSQIKKHIQEESECSCSEVELMQDYTDEKSVDVSEFTGSTASEPINDNKRSAEAINTIAQFLMSDWKAAEKVLNSEPRSYKELVDRRDSNH